MGFGVPRGRQLYSKHHSTVKKQTITKTLNIRKVVGEMDVLVKIPHSQPGSSLTTAATPTPAKFAVGAEAEERLEKGGKKNKKTLHGAG